MLIHQYAYLVKATARRIGQALQTIHDRDDLEGVGMLGLIRAIDQFDVDRAVKFETYGITLIRAAILEMIRCGDWAPRSLRVRQKRIRLASVELSATLGREPTQPEIARHLGTDVDEVQQVLGEVGRGCMLSLDDLSEEGRTGQRSWDHPDSATPGPFAALETRERSRALARAMDGMPVREKQVIELYYRRSQTFREIGVKLGVSEARAHQLHGQALNRLRRYLDEDRVLFH
jgi:RNA polymerase sigma factor for flagellar operon FliA